MGFEYVHLQYMETVDDNYQAINIVNTGGLAWVKVFIMLWDRQRRRERLALRGTLLDQE
jgi:hypothetical protein